jgi:hypothetical protein
MRNSTSLGVPQLRSIEGYIMLRRKSLWVKRYAKVENQIFLYRKEKGNHQILVE